MKETESNICQIAAIKGGRLVLSETYLGYSKDDCSHIASATKSIVGLLVGIAPRENFFATNAEEHIPLFRPDLAVPAAVFVNISIYAMVRRTVIWCICLSSSTDARHPVCDRRVVAWSFR